MQTLKLWDTQNLDQHNYAKQLPPNFRSKIDGIYATRPKFLPHVQAKIFKVSKEVLLTKSHEYIARWIENSKRFIKTELHVLAKQHLLQTQDIHQFFAPR